jgi:hypothetical protein
VVSFFVILLHETVLPNHILHDMRTTFYAQCREFGIADITFDEFVGHSLAAIGSAYTELPMNTSYAIG